MKELIVRFLIGGTLVSAFALVGDILRPKSFAGLFGAAPSIALATLGLTIAAQGREYAASEARSMIAGSIAFFIYASVVSKVLMRYRTPALATTLTLMPIWFVTAFGLWFVWVR
jgi:dolichol kinase